jgi:6-pyruvoyltetrahydropterin/6-carboxytetrahydropterin synthase
MRDLTPGQRAMPEITIQVHWEMGHRLPSHDGPCRRLHGHSYAARVTVAGPVKPARGASDDGMIADFARIDRVLRDLVGGWDHRMMLSEHDPLQIADPEAIGVLRVPFVPTAENIAAALLVAAGSALPGLRVTRVEVQDAPGAWVRVEPDEML